MAKEDTAAEMGRRITELRGACQMSRQELGRLLAEGGMPKTSAFRLEAHGRVTTAELAVLRAIMTARVEYLRRCATEVTELLKHLPSAGTVEESAPEPEPEPKPAKRSAPKAAPASKATPKAAPAPARRASRKAAAATSS